MKKSHQQDIADSFEGKALAIIMAEGFDSEEAQAIFDDWVERKYKRLKAGRFSRKLMAIR